eukprot:6185898-Pleurochrysis_carterae.AAC.3
MAELLTLRVRKSAHVLTKRLCSPGCCQPHALSRPSAPWAVKRPTHKHACLRAHGLHAKP